MLFALPLSLGYESSVEIMDFNLTEEVPFEEVKEKLNKVMPEGIKIVKIYTPETMRIKTLGIPHRKSGTFKSSLHTAI